MIQAGAAHPPKPPTRVQRRLPASQHQLPPLAPPLLQHLLQQAQPCVGAREQGPPEGTGPLTDMPPMMVCWGATRWARASRGVGDGDVPRRRQPGSHARCWDFWKHRVSGSVPGRVARCSINPLVGAVVQECCISVVGSAPLEMRCMPYASCCWFTLSGMRHCWCGLGLLTHALHAAGHQYCSYGNCTVSYCISQSLLETRGRPRPPPNETGHSPFANSIHFLRFENESGNPSILILLCRGVAGSFIHLFCRGGRRLDLFILPTC